MWDRVGPLYKIDKGMNGLGIKNMDLSSFSADWK